MKSIAIKSLVAGAALVLGGLAIAGPANAAELTPAGTLSVGTCTTSTTFTVASLGNKKFVVPTTSAGKRDCRLEQGNQSSAVTVLQKNLKNGCEAQDGNLATDGQFGPATKAALVADQKALKITADGIYGSQTASKMNWLSTDGKVCYAFSTFN